MSFFDLFHFLQLLERKSFRNGFPRQNNTLFQISRRACHDKPRGGIKADDLCRCRMLP